MDWASPAKRASPTKREELELHGPRASQVNRDEINSLTLIFQLCNN